jgi:large conductance mechanosensitive channel
VPVLAWGNCLTITLNFIIFAFIIFLTVKQTNRLKKEAPVALPATPGNILLLRPIRDNLKFSK